MQMLSSNHQDYIFIIYLDILKFTFWNGVAQNECGLIEQYNNIIIQWNWIVYKNIFLFL